MLWPSLRPRRRPRERDTRCWLQRKAFPIRCPMLPPLSTVGPSRPRARPLPMARIPPKNFTGRMCAGLSDQPSLSSFSTCGIPLPLACGENRLTIHAAMPTASALPTMRISSPAKPSPCAHCAMELRRTSPRCRPRQRGHRLLRRRCRPKWKEGRAARQLEGLWRGRVEFRFAFHLW